MRILFLNQFYKPDAAATGQFLADLTEELGRREHEVHVICSRSRYDGGKPIAVKEERIKCINIHRVFTTRFGRQRLPGRAVDYLSFYISAAWRALRIPKPDVCVSLTTPPFISLIGLVLEKLRGTRNVIWVMDVYPEIAVAYRVLPERSLLCRVLARMSRLLYRNADAVISLGEFMAQHLESVGAPSNTIHIVHNWNPVEDISQNF